MLVRFFKKFLNIIPYLALLYFLLARSFLIFGQAELAVISLEKNDISKQEIFIDYGKKIAEFFEVKSDKKLSADDSQEENKILAAFFNFCVDILLTFIVVFVASFILFDFAFRFYEKIKLVLRRFSYQMRAPPSFS